MESWATLLPDAISKSPDKTLIVPPVILNAPFCLFRFLKLKTPADISILPDQESPLLRFSSPFDISTVPAIFVITSSAIFESVVFKINLPDSIDRLPVTAFIIPLSVMSLYTIFPPFKLILPVQTSFVSIFKVPAWISEVEPDLKSRLWALAIVFPEAL